jgi:hypothetical protein
MLNLDARIRAFDSLGNILKNYLNAPNALENEWLYGAVSLSFSKNGWFTEREVHFALAQWAELLNEGAIKNWIDDDFESTQPAKVGLVLAGNIPLVGFHDVLSTILAGHIALIKCSSSDDVLIPTLLFKTRELEPGLSEHFEILSGKLSEHEAIIATGSNNSARYFHAYFGNIPHIIRQNRTSVAVLDGSETKEELNGLMLDCFGYFGLGCRSITKLYLPKNFDVNRIFEASVAFSHLMDNKKYINNYTYHKALMMMERQPVLDNELVLLLESTSLFSPVSVLNYEFYDNEAELGEMIESNLDQIQCVVGHKNLPFGSLQCPSLSDYADGVNTLDFLKKLTFDKLPN